VLCNLDYEYPTNVRIIVSAVTKLPHNQNNFADSAAAMLGRLIQRGDKGLLRVLFAAAPYSDAALGEALDGFNPWLSLEAGGGFHFLSPSGGNGAVGMKINPWTLEVCFYVRTCVRTGFGIYGGGGLTGAFNLDLAKVNAPAGGQRI